MENLKRPKAKQSSYRLFQDQAERINNAVFDRTQAQTLDNFQRVEASDIMREVVDKGLEAIGYPLPEKELVEE